MSGGTVVLLHGQPGAGADFSALIAQLDGEFEVMAPDRPGWATSPEPAAGLAANADWLAATLHASGSKQVVVVGHSLGGGVALELALRHPPLVGALVLVGSVGVERALTAADHVLAFPIVGTVVLWSGVTAVRAGVAVATRLNSTRGVARVAHRVAHDPALRAAVGGAGGPLVGRARRSFVVEQRDLMRATPGLDAAHRPRRSADGGHDGVLGPGRPAGCLPRAGGTHPRRRARGRARWPSPAVRGGAGRGRRRPSLRGARGTRPPGEPGGLRLRPPGDHERLSAPVAVEARRRPASTRYGRTAAARKACSLSWVSTSSVFGSESATMPTPAKSRAVSPSTRAQRSPRCHSPSPSAFTQPTGPA